MTPKELMALLEKEKDNVNDIEFWAKMYRGGDTYPEFQIQDIYTTQGVVQIRLAENKGGRKK